MTKENSARLYRNSSKSPILYLIILFEGTQLYVIILKSILHLPLLNRVSEMKLSFRINPISWWRMLKYSPTRTNRFFNVNKDFIFCFWYTNTFRNLYMYEYACVSKKSEETERKRMTSLFIQEFTLDFWSRLKHTSLCKFYQIITFIALYDQIILIITSEQDQTIPIGQYARIGFQFSVFFQKKSLLSETAV
jgi:hypothetical protein